MIVYSRSPYFVEVYVVGAVGSKIEIFLANGTASLPSTPTYTISKNYNNSETYHPYNISNYLREYIDNISVDTTNNKNFAKIQVKSYKENSGGSYTLLSTLEFLGTNGYTLYTQGASYTDSNASCVILGNTEIENYYQRISGNTPFMNVLINSYLGDKLEVVLTDLNGGNSETTTLLATSTAATKAILKASLTNLSNSAYSNGNYCIIKYYQGSTLSVNKTIKVTPICEAKYTPVKCQFINRFGGWQVLTFFKQQTNSINVQGTSYNVIADSYNYNVATPQTASFNINGRQTIKLNTGWVPQSYSELIQDLILAETILLDGKPVEIKTQNTDLKTSLNDKNINYELEFEYAYNLINNVI